MRKIGTVYCSSMYGLSPAECFATRVVNTKLVPGKNAITQIPLGFRLRTTLRILRLKRRA